MMTKLYVSAVTFFSEFKRDERGVTAIEYGLIGVAMAVALATVLGTTEGQFLQELKDAFTGIAGKLTAATSG